MQGLPFAQDAIGLIWVFLGVLVVVVLVAIIGYLLTLQKALTRVSPHNRAMEPGMVWLSLLPCVNLIWQFVIAVNVPESLRREFRERGRDDGSDYGRSLALTQAIIGMVSQIIKVGPLLVPEAGFAIAALSVVLTLIGLVSFILFWLKIAAYSTLLALDDRREMKRRLEKFDDDDDDRDYPKGTGPMAPPPESIQEGDPGRYQ